MRCRRLSAGTIQLQPLHDQVIRYITDCCDMPGIAEGQQVMGARLGTATHVAHSSICIGCGACERGREHVASASAARRLLEPVDMSPAIALQLQESCCKHMGCPHAICTTCRPSALEGCYVRMRCRRLSAGTIQLQPLHDHVTGHLEGPWGRLSQASMRGASSDQGWSGVFLYVRAGPKGPGGEAPAPLSAVEWPKNPECL